MNRLLFVALFCCASALGTSDASAQQRCNNRDTINCVWDPATNQWIIRGSAPSPEPPSQAAPEQAPGMLRADPASLERARAREKQGNAATLAAARPFAEQFRPVFDQVRIDEYKPFVNRFPELIKPSMRIFGSVESGNEMWAAQQQDAGFWGPLYLRMAVACIELGRLDAYDGWVAKGLEYLSAARKLGYPDADEILYQMSILGLASLVPERYGERAAFTKDVERWREAAASANPPKLKMSPRIDLAARYGTFAARRQAEQERVAAVAKAAEEAARQKAAVDAARADEARQQRDEVKRQRDQVRQQEIAVQAATSQRVLAAVDARWRAAGIDYPLSARLPPEREAALVQDALSAVPRYEAAILGPGVREKDRRALQALKAALAGGNCSPGAATDCMALLVASQEAAYVFPDDNLDTIRHDLGIVECHARRVPLACRLAGDGKRKDAGDRQFQAQRLAYWTLSCISPGELKGFGARCDLAWLLERGEFGPPDAALANDVNRLSCAFGESDAACDKVAAAAKSQAAASPSTASERDKPAATTQAHAKPAKTAASPAGR